MFENEYNFVINKYIKNYCLNKKNNDDPQLHLGSSLILSALKFLE